MRQTETLRVALFGATGTVGHATALALVAAGHDVTCFGRSKPPLPLPFVETDLSAEADIFHGKVFDVALSCIASRTGVPEDAWAVDHRANSAILAQAQAAGIKHFILLSAICVQKPKLAFQHAKLCFEAELRASPLRWTIVRPTALFKSLSGQVVRVQAGKPFLIFGNGRLTACKPISDRDLAAFMVSSLTDPEKWDRVLPIGGPGPAQTPHAQGLMLFEMLGTKPRFRSVSPKLLLWIERLLRTLGWILPQMRSKAALARIGHYYATESMLHWDARQERYDPDATPEFGADRLEDHYKRLILGEIRHEPGDHGVF